MAEVKVTAGNFEAEVLKADKLVRSSMGYKKKEDVLKLVF